MLHSLAAKEFQTEQPICVRPHDSIMDVIALLVNNKISGVTVVDEDNNVVGVISELDCLRATLDGAYQGQIGGAAKDYMTKQVDFADPDSDLIAVAQQMLANNRRRLPIMKHGKFMGQFSARSVLLAVSRYATRFHK